MSRAASFSCRAADGRFFLRFVESFGTFGELVQSARHRVRLPLVARPRPLAISCAPSPARSEPWASRPAPSLASEMPPRSCSTPPAATLRLRPRRPSCLTGPMLPSEASAALPCSCSGLVRFATWAGPITNCTPGIRAIRRCQRSSASRFLASVIGPSSLAATTWYGASKPGLSVSAISSTSFAGRRVLRQLFGAGQARSSARSPGAERSRTTPPIRIAARRRALQGGPDQDHQARVSRSAPGRSASG